MACQPDNAFDSLLNGAHQYKGTIKRIFSEMPASPSIILVFNSMESSQTVKARIIFGIMHKITMINDACMLTRLALFLRTVSFVR